MSDPVDPPADAPPPALHPIEPHSIEPHSIEAAIDAWFVDRIHDSPVARSTEAFNHLRNALADLKRRIIQEI
ncbi:MAG TPA: hypothetical protein VNT30_10415 [Stellaceae bacterium]|nr:hypothetical protein [Stellaceae bacterium]